ncbi:hypothetical protein VPH35_017540 [Triticum aestivum]
MELGSNGENKTHGGPTLLRLPHPNAADPQSLAGAGILLLRPPARPQFSLPPSTTPIHAIRSTAVPPPRSGRPRAQGRRPSATGEKGGGSAAIVAFRGEQASGRKREEGAGRHRGRAIL